MVLALVGRGPLGSQTLAQYDQSRIVGPNADRWLPVNRAQLRQLAEDRILDAACLLAGGRWAGAYYLAGYSVECGLKACIMAHVEAIGAIFQDRKFSEKCWTHDLEDLLKLANLGPTLETDAAANAALFANWAVAKDWKRAATSRRHSRTRKPCTMPSLTTQTGCSHGYGYAGRGSDRRRREARRGTAATQLRRDGGLLAQGQRGR